MSYYIVKLLQFAGAVGLFLYGMKLMSEALQKVAGARMRSVFASINSNKYKSALTGIFVSAIIQSSNVIVLMVISFVNAGLVSLSESIAVILGANLGATITGWLIAWGGFRINLSTYALPLMAIGFPLLFRKRGRYRLWAEIIIGFSLLFLSLDFIKNIVPDVNNNTEVLIFLKEYTNLGFLSVIIFVLIGILLTTIIQSSGASLAIILVMSNQGWITYELGAAMILGENIGITIAPNVAATIANINAKRTARIHLYLKIIGVITVLLIFTPSINIIKDIVTSVSRANGDAIIPFSLALFHTVFNFSLLIIFIGLIPLITRFIADIVPNKDMEGEEFKLKYINNRILSTAELSFIQARKELISFSKYIKKMLRLNRKLMFEKNETKSIKLFKNIEHYEAISDDIEIELANYLAKIPKNEFNEQRNTQIRTMLKLVGDLENIVDSCFSLARIINKKNKQKINYNSSIINKLQTIFNLVEESLTMMRKNIRINKHNKINLQKVSQIKENINNYENKFEKEIVENIEDSEETIYILKNIISKLNKISKLSYKVSETLAKD